MWKFFKTPQCIAPLYISTRRGVLVPAHKYAQEQQQTNVNMNKINILLYVQMFAHLTFSARVVYYRLWIGQTRKSLYLLLMGIKFQALLSFT